jgi:predicted RNase H-like HicB family nuclease
MTRKYSLVIEGEHGSFSAYVPELPTILITGKSLQEIDSLATEAIALYLEEMGPQPPTSVVVHQVEVELPA